MKPRCGARRVVTEVQPGVCAVLLPALPTGQQTTAAQMPKLRKKTVGKLDYTSSSFGICACENVSG